MIVIDVGCADYGSYDSLWRLEQAFGARPEWIYGCDPNPQLQEMKERFEENPFAVTNLYLKQEAAWTFDGEVHYLADGLNSCVSSREDLPLVPCFDLAKFIRSLGSDDEIVLKIDAEGAEYDLLEHLIATHTDELLKLAWVEWHPNRAGLGDTESRRKVIEEQLVCELREWAW